MRPVYITGLGIVSPLHEDVDERVCANKNIKPNYKDLLQGVNLRRMSPILKDSLYSGIQCITDAGSPEMDGIIVGTGLGCIADTQMFLSNINKTQEGVLSPTQFIQSTHNTISGQIAMLLGCKKYNSTYTQKGMSFENALVDGRLMIEEGASHVLVGGADEITDDYLTITKKMGRFDGKEIKRDKLYDDSNSAIPGEGSVFFMLSANKSSGAYAKLLDLQVVFNEKDRAQIAAKLNQMLLKNGLKPTDIDLIVTGHNGHEKHDLFIDDVLNNALSKTITVKYKHVSGEYYTASNFGMWLGVKSLKDQKMIAQMKYSKPIEKPITNVLVYNFSCDGHHSLMLLQNVKT